MAGTKSNPNDVNGPNEYAGFVAPSRPDKSTINYYGDDSSGNTVDSARIPKTLDSVGGSSAAKPLGSPQGSGY